MFSTHHKCLLFLFFAGVNLISAVEYSVGSAHPYTNSLRQYTPVYVNGAIGYYVRFDNRSSTVSGDQDYVSLYKNNAYNTYWGSPYYSGALNSGAWSPSDILTIYNSSFIVYFHTDSSGTSWGYKLYYTPIFVGPIPVQEVLIIGSPHNYWASIDVYTTICIPGATGYNIVFDDRSSTVSGDQDYMTIFQDATHTTVVRTMPALLRLVHGLQIIISRYTRLLSLFASIVTHLEDHMATVCMSTPCPLPSYPCKSCLLSAVLTTTGTA